MIAAAVIILRLASAAPDGTAWAREFRALERDVDAHTHGEVKVKWYMDGIAGDELEVPSRMTRGQIDGTASGGAFCQKVSPSMRLTRLQGMFERHEEASFLLSRFRDSIEEEMGQRSHASRCARTRSSRA